MMIQMMNNQLMTTSVFKIIQLLTTLDMEELVCLIADIKMIMSEISMYTCCALLQRITGCHTVHAYIYV